MFRPLRELSACVDIRALSSFCSKATVGVPFRSNLDSGVLYRGTAINGRDEMREEEHQATLRQARPWWVAQRALSFALCQKPRHLGSSWKTLRRCKRLMLV